MLKKPWIVKQAKAALLVLPLIIFSPKVFATPTDALQVATKRGSWTDGGVAFYQIDRQSCSVAQVRFFRNKEALYGDSDLFTLKLRAKRKLKYDPKAMEGILVDKDLNSVKF